METELWPNLLHECRRRGVPVVLASARLTAKSVARYRRIGALIRGALSDNTLVAAQTPEDAERFIAIGATGVRTHVIGNVKFDMELGDSIIEKGRNCAARYSVGRPVWIAGSTHGGEEEQLLDGARRAAGGPGTGLAGTGLVDAGAAASAALRKRVELVGRGGEFASIGAVSAMRCGRRRKFCWWIPWANSRRCTPRPTWPSSAEA